VNGNLSDLWWPVAAVALYGLVRVVFRTRERGEQRVESRTRLLARALESASDCVSLTDTDGRIVYVNDSFARTYGYPARELIGRPISALRAANNPPETIEGLATATKTGGWRGVLWSQSKQGRTFPVSLATSTVRDHDGTTIGAIGVARDVTREQAEERALRESAEKFAKIFRVSPDCIVVSAAGPGGVLEVNDRFEAITGMPRSAIIGRTITDLGVMVDPTTRGRWIEELRRTGSIRHSEYQVRRPGGDISTFVMSAESLELQGRPCFLSVHHDITDSVRTRDALRQTEAKYRDLVENANDVIFMIDRDGQCLWMNKAGRDVAGDSAGAHWSKIVAAEHAQMVESQIARVFDGERIPPFELDIVNAEGRRVALELAIRAVYEGGVAVGAQGIARDVTERKELETQLRHAQKMQAVGALAGGVAHEFNNLLAELLGYAAIAAEQIEPGTALAHDIENISRTAWSARALTRQLLVFGRKDPGRPVLLDVNDVLGQVEKMLRRIVGRKILLVVQLGNNLGQVRMDAGRLEQVIMSLVVNAREAMPHGGTLTIATDAVELREPSVRLYPGLMAGPFVRLTVSDSGVGMTPDVQSQIFTPFFTTKSESKGAGLGLAAVHGIVHQADGCIVVESAPEQGSAFTVYLPRAAAPVEKTERLESVRHVAQPEPATPEPAPTVLFVEEDDAARALGARLLRQHGYTVLSAHHGEEAMDIAQHFDGAIDVLVTNIVVSGLDGRSLHAHLRKSREQLKVLLLPKPYWPERLATAIRDVLQDDL
jgi:two-component system, cell cycle sensor histidine kinase and response regulator CckA